jgi:hypothetical protein
MARGIYIPITLVGALLPDPTSKSGGPFFVVQQTLTSWPWNTVTKACTVGLILSTLLWNLENTIYCSCILEGRVNQNVLTLSCSCSSVCRWKSWYYTDTNFWTDVNHFLYCNGRLSTMSMQLSLDCTASFHLYQWLWNSAPSWPRTFFMTKWPSPIVHHVVCTFLDSKYGLNLLRIMLNCYS